MSPPCLVESVRKRDLAKPGSTGEFLHFVGQLLDSSPFRLLLFMLIYEVNLTADEDVATRYSAWLREHIREMLEVDGFEAAVWYDRHEDGDTTPEDDEPTDPREWTIQYQVRDRAALQSYFDEHANEMRREAVEKFGEHLESSRRIFEQKRLFQN